jgi:hypothetical protein
MAHKIKALPFIAACVLFGTTVAANASPYVVTIKEVGFNVVATGSGEFNLTGLSPGLIGTFSSEVQPLSALIFTGALGNTTLYSGLSGPSTFGIGGSTGASSGISGDIVGLSRVDGLYVPLGYVSGNPLSDSATYDNATLASLGITPGTYVWTWGGTLVPGGGAPDQSFTIIAGTPLPAALPLFATGLGAIGLLGWRRKRKAQAA